MTTLRQLLEISGFVIPEGQANPVQTILDVELSEHFYTSQHGELVFFGILLINDLIAFSAEQINYTIWDSEHSQTIIINLAKRLFLEQAMHVKNNTLTRQIGADIVRDFKKITTLSPNHIGLICKKISGPLDKLVQLAFKQAGDKKPTSLIIGLDNPFILGYQLGPNPDFESCLPFDWQSITGHELTIVAKMINLLGARDKVLTEINKYAYQRHGFQPSSDQLATDSIYSARSQAENRPYQPRVWRSQSASFIRQQQRQAIGPNPGLLAVYEDEYQVLLLSMTNQDFKDRFKHLAMIANLSLVPVPNLTEIISFMLTFGVGEKRDNQQINWDLKAIFDELGFDPAVCDQLAKEFIALGTRICLDRIDELGAMARICEEALSRLNQRLEIYSSVHPLAKPEVELRIKWALLQSEVWLRVQAQVQQAIEQAARPGLAS